MLKKLIAGIASVSLALGMVALTAGPASADADPVPPIGTFGTPSEATPQGNSAAFWGANCYKDDTTYGSVTNDGKTVTLNPGFTFTLLVVKAATTNLVTQNPVAGVDYASPLTNPGGPQANVSHWIVCLGTPKDASAAVTTIPPTCDANGSATIGTVNNATWDGVLDTSVGTHTETFTAVSGHLFSDGTSSLVVEYTVVGQLNPLSDVCLIQVVPAATVIEPTCGVDTESQTPVVGPSFVRVFWSEGIASYDIEGYGPVLRPADLTVLYTDVETGDPNEELTVTPTVLPGYVSSVPYVTVTFGAKIINQCGIIGDPIPTDETCVRGNGQGGSLWVERHEGLSYTITGGALVDDIVIEGLGEVGDPYLDGNVPLEPGIYTVSTAALPGYVLEPDELDNLPLDFTIHAPLEGCVVVVTVNCTLDEGGQFTLPAIQHVVWTVDVPSDGNPPLFVNVPGGFSIPVTIAATYISASIVDPGFVFSNPLVTSWYLQLTEGDAQCGDLLTLPPIPTAVSVTNEQCVDGKHVAATITVGQVNDDNWFPEVNYFLDGSDTPLDAITTVISAGHHTVTAEPKDPDNSIDENYEDSWEFTVLAAPTSCDLTTLALTGTDSNPAGWAGLGYYLLVAGLALIAVRTLRRRHEVKQ